MVTTANDYSHTIGIASFEGRGFMNPIDVIFNDELLYVLSRSNASNKNNRISALTVDSNHKFEFANWGEEPGKSILPTAIEIDKDNKIILSDEHLNRISIFDLEGKLINHWGEFGNKEGQLNRPSGISIDSENNILVVDHLNSRIQKFDTSGKYISCFGKFGKDVGEFNYPWGIDIDKDQNIYIADWRNNRVQIFNSNGIYVNSIENYEDQKLAKPSSVHISTKGNIFVTNWADNSVIIYDSKLNFISKLIGDATISKWCQEFLDVNPEQSSWREEAGLFEEEKRFWRPQNIDSNEDLIFITDSCRHRIQIYKNRF